MGWGAEEDGEGLSVDLKEARVTVLPHKTCQNIYPDVIIDETMICVANGTQETIGSCQVSFKILIRFFLYLSF